MATTTISPGTLLAGKLKQTVLEFEKNPMRATREIREFSEAFPDEFLPSAVAVLLETVDTPGGTYLLKLLLAQGSMVAVICSPYHLRHDQAHQLVERSKRIDPFFEWKLFRQAADEVERGLEGKAEISMRALDLLSITARSAHQIPVVRKLLQHPNARVRSRAATLMAKVTRDLDWVVTSLDDGEARVRANTLEAFWNPGVSETLKSLLWKALSDTDNRAVGNALLGLYRQGDQRMVCLMREMTTDPSERFRSTAVWLLGQTGQKELLVDVQPLVRDPSLMVRRAAVRAARNLNSAPIIIKNAVAESGNVSKQPQNASGENAVNEADASDSGTDIGQRPEASARLKLLLEHPAGSQEGRASQKPLDPGPPNKSSGRSHKEKQKTHRR